jgi:hypothetical protein
MAAITGYLSSWWYPQEQKKEEIQISLPTTNDSNVTNGSTKPKTIPLGALSAAASVRSAAPVPSTATAPSAAAHELPPDWELNLPPPKKKGWLW